MRPHLTVITSALLLSLTACGWSGKHQAATSEPGAALSRSIPFPDDRGASALTEYVLNGAAADLSSAGAVPSGTAMVLSAEVGGYEYALYRFNAPGLGSPGELDSVSVLLEDGVTSEAWIGIADYDASRWIFDGPFTKPKTLAVDAPRYVSPAGDVWVAVMVAAEQSATVNALSVRTINPANEAPTAALDADVTSGNAPLTVQFDASGSSDTDGTIIEYAWDFNGDGLYDGFSDDPVVSHLYPGAGLFSAKVRVTDEQFARATATVEINVNVIGNEPPVADLSATPDSGDAPLLVALDASGSTDADGSIVRYEWDFDGDGLYEAYGDNPTAEHSYTEAGLNEAVVRITDSSGAQATASVEINVNVLGNEPPEASYTRTPGLGNAPLSVDFDASGSFDPDGSIVRYDWDFESDGTWDAYDAGPTVTHVFTEPGFRFNTLRVTDDSGAQDGVQINLNVNGSPAAELTTDTPKVNKGETVFLDASGSSDADGSIVDYEWDLDGDGTFNEAGAEADSQGSATAAVLMGDTSGEFLAQVRVTDEDGAQDTASLTLTVLGWLLLAIDTTGGVGEYTSLAVVDGKPAISYYDYTNDDLKYAYSSTADGSDPADWTAIAVDTAGNVGLYTSLAVVNGKPAISYYDTTNTDLKYAYSSTADGSSGWTTLAVDTTGNVGGFTSLAVVNGRPAISYYDNLNDDLKYAYSSTADGSSGWTAITVDATGNVGNFYSSLAVVNGKPAIAYLDNTNQDLKYAYSSTLDGADSADWTALIVDSVDNTGSNPSLAVVDGRPAISYREFTPPTDLKYAYSSTADGSSGWTSLTIDSGIGAQNSSLAVVNGKPATSYRDDANNDLKYAYSSTVDGSASWTTIALDTVGNVGEFSSQAVLTSGRPAISYFDATNGDLKYAVLSD